MSFLLLQKMAGIDFLLVPYQGSGPATIALQGVLSEPAVKEKLARGGMTASYASPEAFWEAIEADIAMMQGLFRGASNKP